MCGDKYIWVTTIDGDLLERFGAVLGDRPQTAHPHARTRPGCESP